MATKRKRTLNVPELAEIGLVYDVDVLRAAESIAAASPFGGGRKYSDEQEAAIKAAAERIRAARRQNAPGTPAEG